MSKRFNRVAYSVPLLLTLIGTPALGAAVPSAAASDDRERLIVVARSDADYDELRVAAEQAGASIVKDIRDGGMLVVRANNAAKAQIQATGLSKGIAKDHIEKLVPNAAAGLDLTNSSGFRSRTALDDDESEAVAEAEGRHTRSDPAFSFPGLMWSIERIRAPRAWEETTGSPSVTVGVADTGLDFTHSELACQVVHVEYIIVKVHPPICKSFARASDADLTDQSGGPHTS